MAAMHNEWNRLFEPGKYPEQQGHNHGIVAFRQIEQVAGWQ
jgi:hypothetical protein